MITVYMQKKKCVKKWNEKNVSDTFVCSLRTVQIPCLVVASSHTCLSQPDMFLFLHSGLASFRASSLALLFFLSFCCNVLLIE